MLIDKMGLDRQAAEQFVARMFDVLNDGLRYDKQVKVKGLGTFKVTSVASRKSVDVNTGEPIVIEGRDKISFTADASLRDQVNRPFAQFETVVINEGVDFDEIDRRYADSMDEDEEQGGVDMEPTDPVEDMERQEQTEDKPLPMAESTDATAADDTHPLVIAASQLAVLNGSTAVVQPQVDVEGEDSTTVSVSSVSEEVPAAMATDVPTAAPTAEKSVEEPLGLSPQQLAILNGSPATVANKPASSQPESIEPQVETVSEPTVEALATMPEPQDEAVVPNETDTATPQSAAHSVEVSQESPVVTLQAQTLLDKVERQQHNLRVLMVVASLLLLVCLGGIFYLASQLDKRNHRIEHLEAAAISARHAARQHAAAKAEARPDTVARQHADSLRQLATAAEAARKSEAARLVAQQKAEQEAAAARKSEEDAARRKAEERKAAEAKRTADARKATEEKAQAAQQKAYDADPRIRTGAYNIIGIDRTVTVRSGQTLTSISRANLGPGMECYVEAVNGGRKEFKAGEKINLPKLKLKKK